MGRSKSNKTVFLCRIAPTAKKPKQAEVVDVSPLVTNLARTFIPRALPTCGTDKDLKFTSGYGADGVALMNSGVGELVPLLEIGKSPEFELNPRSWRLN